MCLCRFTQWLEDWDGMRMEELRQCNAEGVVFLEAETSCAIDDLGDFESSVKLMNLAPPVDSNEDISSYPLILVQVHN